MKNDKIKNTIILCIIIIFFVGAILIVKYFNKEDGQVQYLKNYKMNEYIPTYISNEDMAKIYLNDYIHNMYFDIEKAYSLLDNEYKTLKFGNIDNYKTYVKGLSYTSYTMSKYYITKKDGFIIFGVYDTNNNLFVFKTKGVMQYSVYLDDYTIEI